MSSRVYEVFNKQVVSEVSPLDRTLQLGKMGSRSTLASKPLMLRGPVGYTQVITRQSLYNAQVLWTKLACRDMPTAECSMLAAVLHRSRRRKRDSSASCLTLLAETSCCLFAICTEASESYSTERRKHKRRRRRRNR